jgi:uncharacterized membrane protein
LLQRSSRATSPLRTLTFLGLFGSIVLLPFVWSELGQPGRDTFIFLTVLGILTFVAAILNLHALRDGKLAVVDVVMGFELPLTVLIGVIFVHETISALQLALIAAVFVGLSLLAIREPGWHRRIIERGVLLALARATIMALVNAFTGVGARTTSPVVAIWFPTVCFTVFCLVIILRRGEILISWEQTKKEVLLLSWTSEFYTAAWVF